ncbi:unnamed protein product, partial [Musa textilis]
GLNRAYSALAEWAKRLNRPAWGGGTAWLERWHRPYTQTGGGTAWLGRWHRPSHQTRAVAPLAWGGGTAPVRQSTD